VVSSQSKELEDLVRKNNEAIIIFISIGKWAYFPFLLVGLVLCRINNVFIWVGRLWRSK
jgi:hypothetical protein